MKKLALLLFLVLFSIPSFSQSTHSVGLTWSASVDAAGNPSLTYNIYKLNSSCPSSGTTGFTKLGSPVSVLTFNDTTVSVGNTYCYYITSDLNGLESLPSNTAQAVILPGAPQSLQTKVN